MVRSVSRYESLGEYDRMMDRIVQLRREGLTIKELAARATQRGIVRQEPRRAIPQHQCFSSCAAAD